MMDCHCRAQDPQALERAEQQAREINELIKESKSSRSVKSNNR